MTAFTLWSCSGSRNIPVPEPPPFPVVEFPKQKLDFFAVTDKKVYMVGEPVTITIKVRNDDSIPHSLTFEPFDPSKVPNPQKEHEKLRGFLSACLFLGPGIRGFKGLSYTYGQDITILVPPKSELTLDALTIIWKQDEEVLKEIVGVGNYTIESVFVRLLKLDGQTPPDEFAYRPDIDGGGGLYIYQSPPIRITHPVVEALEEKGILLGGFAPDSLNREPVPIFAAIWNLSKTMKRTVTIKPVSNMPSVRIRVFGPVDRRIGYFIPPPPMIAMRERRDEIEVTINPNRGYKVLEFLWDLRDEVTGQMLPPEQWALAVIEFCGEFWVDGERIGVIEEPLKVAGGDIYTGMEIEIIVIPPSPPLGGGSSSGGSNTTDPTKPPKPPEW